MERSLILTTHVSRHLWMVRNACGEGVAFLGGVCKCLKHPFQQGSTARLRMKALTVPSNSHTGSLWQVTWKGKMVTPPAESVGWIWLLAWGSKSTRAEHAQSQSWGQTPPKKNKDKRKEGKFLLAQPQQVSVAALTACLNPPGPVATPFERSGSAITSRIPSSRNSTAPEAGLWR